MPLKLVGDCIHRWTLLLILATLFRMIQRKTVLRREGGAREPNVESCAQPCQMMMKTKSTSPSWDPLPCPLKATLQLMICAKTERNTNAQKLANALLTPKNATASAKVITGKAHDHEFRLLMIYF